ncbi:hypothetical protein AVEN_152642-1 [Araneus ventricosus]|uniref:Endonuclease/exonuclease/phosphatase domain-containing protein n=1 Tax=Araneus ventricosus TaxID=182803 RepID=A0A4Y2NEV7_ARAVE|nr:hypothetical protein AVEN_152642-1 [Araneus ventricosus]
MVKGVAVQLERDQDVEDLIQTIINKGTLKSTIETKKPGERYPSIIIYNLPDETTEDEIQEALAVNADIMERLNIRFKLSDRQPATKTKLATAFNSSDYKRIQTCHGQRPAQPQRYIIQINLAKSKVATAHLAKLASEININHFLVQEPYVKESKIAGVPRKWHQWLSSSNKAGIISLPSTNNPIFICSTTNLTAIKIQTITGPVNLISAYSSPFAEVQDTAQYLANLLTKIGPEQALIGADMNAPSTLWGYANDSPRGNIMEDLMSGLNLHLLNEKNSEPTFQRRNAKVWPDLTLVKGVQLARTASWKVRDELSLSDHKYIHT